MLIKSKEMFEIVPNSSFVPGFQYKNFIVKRATFIEELQVTLVELLHTKSHASIMHIAAEDSENLFCLSFRTLPPTSNGVAHILEHTVLCGSEKFPVRDPFFSMTRRSLNTFMNALTGADFTCYPAASQIEKDFYNLLAVYLDAVFHPTLDRLSFLQEGHRLEFQQPHDPSTPLECRGVVYNEMKGALSSPTTRLMEAVGKALFPDVPYGCNSGGDPKEIPSLTHEALKTFWHEYYHPSRCLFYFYGDIPLQKHLDYLEAHAFKDVKAASCLPPVPKQPRFTAPRTIEGEYPSTGDANQKTMIACAWLTCANTDHITTLALSILESILMETDGSLLKLPLLQSGICSQVISSLDTELAEVPWSISCIGCTPDAHEKIDNIVNTALEGILRQGIDPHLVENALHLAELARSEIVGNGSPYGLSLFWRSGLVQQHGGDPLSGLQIHNQFNELRTQIAANPRFFEELIQTYLLDNPHRICVILRPSHELVQKEADREKDWLEEMRSKLTQDEIKVIVQDSAALKALQEDEAQNNNCLPTISLQDAPKESRKLLLHHSHINHTELFSHLTFTNQISYLDVIRPLPHIPKDDVWLLRLFSYLLPQLGAGPRNYQQNLEYIQANTGGIATALSLNLQVDDPNRFTPSFHLRGKALSHKLDKLAQLLFETTTAPNLSERKRIREIIFKHVTQLETQLNQSGLHYAQTLSASSLNAPLSLKEQWYGIHYFQKLRELAQSYEQQEEQLLQRLQKLGELLLNTQGVQILFTGDETSYLQAQENAFWGLGDLPTRGIPHWKYQPTLHSIPSQIRLLSSPVAFTSYVLPACPYLSYHAPYLSIISQLVDNIYLHQAIREQGGAYGSGAAYNPMAGMFSFYSYRDPHLTSTLEAFRYSLTLIAEGKFDEEDLLEAKREIIQGLDAPLAPSTRGEVAYGWWREGKSFELRQAFREKIFSASCQDIQAAVTNELLPNIPQGLVVSCAGEDLARRENLKLVERGEKSLEIFSI